METSTEIAELATALAKAQGEIEGATKDSANPFFKSKYADLASVWDACRKPLSNHGLAVVQSPSVEVPSPDGHSAMTAVAIILPRVSVETLLLHSSGQWMKNIVSALAKEDAPQAIGSCITYLRRYALQSVVGVAPEDDDAEAAQGRGNGNGRSAQAPSQAPPPKGYEDWLTDLESAVSMGTKALESAWKGSKAEYRTYLTATNAKGWERMKGEAAKVAA